MQKLINKLMEIPFFYEAVQFLVANEGHKKIKLLLKKEFKSLKGRVLDQGCGTGIYSTSFNKKIVYFGIDNNEKDIEFAKKNFRGDFSVGYATKMDKYKDSFFDITFSVGLYHHLTDQQVKRAVSESLRVIKKSGRVIVVDAALPFRKYNLWGLLLRKIDRGRFVRSWQKTVSLMPKANVRKVTYLSTFPLDYVIIFLDKR